MDEVCTNIIRNVATIPDVFEVKEAYAYACPEEWAFADFSDAKRKRDDSRVCSLMTYGFRNGNYSYSLIIVDRNKEIVPVVILHQENIDPCLLAKSWLESRSDSNRGWQAGEDYVGGYVDVSRQSSWVTDDHRELEKVAAASFNGLFCFVNYTEFLRAKNGLGWAPELKLSKDYCGKWKLDIYKVELDNKTVGVAIDPTSVFGDAGLSSSLFACAPFNQGYALALHKTVIDLHKQKAQFPIESVFYGNAYRSFYNTGEHIENAYYCFDATVDGSDFSILPDTVFVKILLYVPWRQRILSRRVNKRWMKLCNVAISIDTKTIRQSSEEFENMGTDDLWRLLPIVSDALEEIEWKLCDSRSSLQTLHEIRAFPSLRIIDMRDGELDYTTFFSLLDKCPNLRELRAVVPTASSTDYSPGTYQVEKLVLPDDWDVEINDSSLMEIINHFPSLIYLRCEYAYVTAADLSLVIGKYGENLAHLRIHCMPGLQSNDDITGMEKCQKLEYLELTSAGFLSNACLKDVANGCQKLGTLNITGCNEVTNDGLTALASLPNLKQLNVSCIFEDLSLGISKIAKQGHLEQLIAQQVHLSAACLKDCVRYCRQLKVLDTAWNEMANQIALEDAKEIIHLFNGWSLSPCLLFRTEAKVWTNPEVKQLREEQKGSGQRRFVVHYLCHYPNPDFIQDDESICSHESTDSNDW